VPPLGFDRWAEHFNKVLNCQSSVCQAATDDMDQWPIFESLAEVPSLVEVHKADKQMSSGKAAGPESITADIYKFSGHKLATKLTSLFELIWRHKVVPQEFRDATVIHLYKWKGNRLSCDNHRGISLLSTAGMLLGRVLLNRMTGQLTHNILPASQCGFRSGKVPALSNRNVVNRVKSYTSYSLTSPKPVTQ